MKKRAPFLSVNESNQAKAFLKAAGEEGISCHLARLSESLPFLVRMVDEEVEKLVGMIDSSLSLQDRLFEILIVRFEILQLYRAAFISISQECFKKPDLALLLYNLIKNSMKRSLELAGSNNISVLPIHVLLGIYHLTFHRWIADETPDMSSTMAFLNSTLNAQRLVKF